ncbi:hypothetical protein M6B38_114775 [Iris pallida]|uniref:Uncharacterized protein n=1 Tax=Iris pallida TaxID=29817 RepID=A0AAX6ICY8_IRIPA|nr:hypothetical protein M6B38_114775 [Iris pallida]
MRRNVAFCWRTLHLARQQSCGLYAAHMRPCGLMRHAAHMRPHAAHAAMRFMRFMRPCGSCGPCGPCGSCGSCALWDLN